MKLSIAVLASDHWLEEISMNDRRRTARNRTLFAGSVAFHPSMPTTDCLVRNLSPAGAKITFAGAAAVPDKFDLTLDRDERTFQARMIWRSAKEAGVVFLGDHVGHEPAGPASNHPGPGAERRQGERRAGGGLRGLIAGAFGIREHDDTALRKRIARISGAA
jgi:PilZ domain